MAKKKIQPIKIALDRGMDISNANYDPISEAVSAIHQTVYRDYREDYTIEDWIKQFSKYANKHPNAALAIKIMNSKLFGALDDEKD